MVVGMVAWRVVWTVVLTGQTGGWPFVELVHLETAKPAGNGAWILLSLFVGRVCAQRDWELWRPRKEVHHAKN